MQEKEELNSVDLKAARVDVTGETQIIIHAAKKDGTKSYILERSPSTGGTLDSWATAILIAQESVSSTSGDIFFFFFF